MSAVLGQARDLPLGRASSGSPTPRTLVPADEADLSHDRSGTGLVIKPAIKEHFFYATRAKAWRADDAADSARRGTAGRPRSSGTGEVIVQELFPAAASSSTPTARSSRTGRAVAEHDGAPAAPAPVRLRPREHVRRDRRPARARASRRLRFLEAIDYYGLVELEYKRDRRRRRVQAARRERPHLGLPHARRGGRRGLPVPAVPRPARSAGPSDRRPSAACGGSGWSPTCPTRCATCAAGRLRPRDYLRTLRGVDTEAVFSSRRPAAGSVRAGAAAVPRGRNGVCDCRRHRWSAVFESSHPFGFFDYFRVPYAVRARGWDSSASRSAGGSAPAQDRRAGTGGGWCGGEVDRTRQRRPAPASSGSPGSPSPPTSSASARTLLRTWATAGGDWTASPTRTATRSRPCGRAPRAPCSCRSTPARSCSSLVRALHDARTRGPGWTARLARCCAPTTSVRPSCRAGCRSRLRQTFADATGGAELPALARGDQPARPLRLAVRAR